MNQRQFASVLFAVVGVFIAATRLPELIVLVGLLAQSSPATESPFSGAPPRQAWTMAVIASVLAILIGGALILFRHRLADRLFAAATQPLEARDAQAVALSVLGCYFAVHGVSRVAWAGRFDWSAAVQLALGIALFFGAHGLSGLWLLSRRADGSRGVRERAV
jgi:hypothetical protein